MNEQRGKSAPTLNVGVIGFGKLGLLHAGIVNALPGSRLAAVCDISSTSLKMLATYMPDVDMHKNHHDMLAKSALDAVFIASPTGLHVDIAADCVASGVPIFIEKPLALNAIQARPLQEALEKRPVVNAVGYMGRYVATFRKAKEIIASRALGRLQMMRANMYVGQLFQPGKGWRYDKAASGGGVLITQNAHLIDKLLWMFGPIERVNGNVTSLYSKTVEDHANAFLKFENGLVGSFDASWSERHVRKPSMSIHAQGSVGTLDVDDDEVRLFLDSDHGDLKAGWTTWRMPDLFEPVTFDVAGPYYTQQAEAFLEAVRSGGSVSSDVASAVQTQKIIDAIYLSAERDGAPIVIAELG